MTDTPTRPRVFIEKIFPVKLLNEQVYYENGGNPFKGLHRWYSRKPLSFSRASVLGSLLPADITLEEFEYLLGLYTEEELAFLQKSNLSKEEKEKKIKSSVKLYKTPPTEKQINRVHELCERVWGTRTPSVLDPFAGGGSIPFEAVRYGLDVFASDLNPVAVVTMKAAMEYPLKFGPELQEDIDKWVKWVGDEAEKRLAEFFPSREGETVQNYLWAHTVECPHCQSVIPLSPNWWVDRSPGAIKKGQICAVKPTPKPEAQRVDFELIKGEKGKGTTIKNNDNEYNPDDFVTIARGVGKCCNCETVIEDEQIKDYSSKNNFDHQLYVVVFKKNKENLEFRLPNQTDIEIIKKAKNVLQNKYIDPEKNIFIPSEPTSVGLHDSPRNYEYGLRKYENCFNTRQLLSLITYLEIISELKFKLMSEYEEIEKAKAILLYLSLIMDRCADMNSRLSRWRGDPPIPAGASASHSLNLMWNYPETQPKRLWDWCSSTVVGSFSKLSNKSQRNSVQLSLLTDLREASISINLESADSLYHLSDRSLNVIITDPPYYGTIQYAELSDFFYVWQKRTLGDIFPDLFWQELTDKDREAVANPSRFRDMGQSPDELAKHDYEAKMSLAWAEAYRVLKDDGVLTVQFNHKDSGAWDTLAKALIDAGFEITASWAVSTENPQNLHQAKKNSVSSTVLLVCRKRDPNAGQAWWDDLRPDVTNLVEQRAPEFEANDITGIDLYLSAFGPALNVFSRQYPILDSSGKPVRPEAAFAEARKAIANYRFRKLVQSETAGFDPLTQWYLLAWDAFEAREFPFDEARQLALAIGGFNVNDLAKTFKLLDSASGTCKLLTPKQRLSKRAFSIDPDSFTARYLVDGLHAVLAIYEEEGTIQRVRQFMQKTGLVGNDLFMKTLEIAMKVIPDGAGERQLLKNLWLGIDEIKAKVIYQQGELF